MKSREIFIYITMVLGFFSVDANAQQKGSILDKKNSELLDEKLEKLNKELGGTTELAFEKKRMEVKFIENGEPYRIDYVYVETLNPDEVYFSEQENAVIAKCKSKDELKGKLKKFSGGCIERHIIKNDIIRAYYRINFDVPGDKDTFIEELKDLIVKATED